MKTLRDDELAASHMEDVPLNENSNDLVKGGEGVVAETSTRSSDVKPSDTSHSEEASAEDAAKKHQQLNQRNMLKLCCKQKKPIENGRDLGVWESSLEDRSGCLSKWLLSYLTPLLQLGSRKVLDQDDIGVPPKQDVALTAYTESLRVWTAMANKCRVANEKLKQNYERKLSKCSTDEERAKIKEPVYKEPSIAWALIRAFGIWELLVGILYYVLSALLAFLPVIILTDLVKFFQSGVDVSEFDGYAHPWVEVAGLAVVPFVVSLLQTRHQTIFAHCAIFVRTAVSALLYRKALRVSAAGRAKTSTGQVVNMMSNDTAQLQRFMQFVGMTIVAPLQIVIALVLIYQQVRDCLCVCVCGPVALWSLLLCRCCLMHAGGLTSLLHYRISSGHAVLYSLYMCSVHVHELTRNTPSFSFIRLGTRHGLELGS